MHGNGLCGTYLSIKYPQLINLHLQSISCTKIRLKHRLHSGHRLFVRGGDDKTQAELLICR